MLKYFAVGHIAGTSLSLEHIACDLWNHAGRQSVMKLLTDGMGKQAVQVRPLLILLTSLPTKFHAAEFLVNQYARK